MNAERDGGGHVDDLALLLAPTERQTEDGSMKTNIDELPKKPLPHVPPPQEPQRPQVQPPTVFVYEKQGWEYKVVTRDAADDALLTEDDLNALGKDGWELVGVAPLTSEVQFYLKRVRS